MVCFSNHSKYCFYNLYSNKSYEYTNKVYQGISVHTLLLFGKMLASRCLNQLLFKFQVLAVYKNL